MAWRTLARSLAGSMAGSTGTIERADPADLAMRAMGAHSPVRQQFGGILLLDADPGSGLDVDAAGRLLAERVRGVPRLGQRLVRVPPGAGRPVWLVDDAFTPAEHIRRATCPAPGDEAGLLELTAALVAEPLPADRPLWVATFVDGLADGRVALVIVLDHVLVDGIGGLAVLDRLVDGVPSPAATVASARPRYLPLVADAWRSRWAAVRRAPAALREIRRALASGGGVHPAPAVPCSLLRRTGPRRQLAIVRADLAAVHDAAHRWGGTVNDAVLVAIAGALHRLLAGRGERVDAFAVAAMVTARRTTSADRLGNAVTPLIVTVPAAGTPVERLRAFAGTVRARRAAATGPPLTALLGPPFRLLAALGVQRWVMGHQRRFHTLVSNLAGPPVPLRFAGAPVAGMVPVAVGESGNVALTFVVLSYAGTLTVTAVADPDAVPDLPVLRDALQAELDELTVAALSPAARPA